MSQIEDLQNQMANRVRKTGDTMSGGLIINVPTTGTPLMLRRAGNQPFVAFSDVDGTPRYGFVMGQATSMSYVAEPTGSMHRWLIGGTEIATLTAGGQMAIDGAFTAGGQVRGTTAADLAGPHHRCR